ncbi:hypothetical protein M569_07248, partial [Genlisea aurea]
MDVASCRCRVANSISRFIHLVTCSGGSTSTMPSEKDYRNVVSLLKHLKPLLDEFTNIRLPWTEAVYEECEDLDAAVNEAREFLEKWSSKKSKIITVLRSKPVLLKIQMSSVKLSSHIFRQLCLQESQNLKIGQLSELMIEILRSQEDSQNLLQIVDSLSLISSPDIVNESIAIEKERQLVEESKRDDEDDLSQTSLAADLMARIQDHVVKLDGFKARNGVPFPSYFRCPLSLELMADPVIVASGQTYERSAIQKWLDHGLSRCPKTGMLLSHRNLIPNFTVRALITNWCEERKVTLSEIQPFASKGSAVIINEENGKLDSSSYAHSRSESLSSVVSSIDLVAVAEAESRFSGKPENNAAAAAAAPPSIFDSTSKRMTAGGSGNQNATRSLLLPSESGCNELTSASHVEDLVKKSLNGDSSEMQTAAVGEIRSLAKYNMENRVIIGESGAIPPLISLLRSDSEQVQEHAVTALLNLSINEKIKSRIAESNAVEPLIHVLRTGNSRARENAAAALFSISLLEEYRIKIGRSGAVKALVDLLQFGSVRGKKDAATALFNLSIHHENKARIVQSGAVKPLVGFLDPGTEMVDKAVALLANLSAIPEGCSAVAREGGIPLLVEIVEIGTPRGKENAAAILLQLCFNSPKYCQTILVEGAVPPLVALSQSGTTRAKEKAQQLLSHFRRQRENGGGRGK